MWSRKVRFLHQYFMEWHVINFESIHNNFRNYLSQEIAIWDLEATFRIAAFRCNSNWWVSLPMPHWMSENNCIFCHRFWIKMFHENLIAGLDATDYSKVRKVLKITKLSKCWYILSQMNTKKAYCVDNWDDPVANTKKSK